MAAIRILGIDPGLNRTGYGVIDVEGGKPRLVTYGAIKTSAKMSLAERLNHIFQSLNTIMMEFQPQQVAVEDLFYAENVKTAIVMGHARGAILVSAMQQGAKIGEFSPREVKMSVVGNGAAAKEQVKFMVSRMLGVKEKISPDDASDALAVALCQWHRLEQVKKGLA